jgi:hypothetical protein
VLRANGEVVTVLRLESRVRVSGVTGREITDFLLDPSDDRYQAWWPGTHLHLHALARGAGDDHVGDVLVMDEYVGSRRLRIAAEVIESVPGAKLVWQMRHRRLRLPAWLTLTLLPEGDGVLLTHAITAGWSGPRRVLDPLWRLYLSRSFAREMDRHAHKEFPMLADLLRRERLGSPPTDPSQAEAPR